MFIYIISIPKQYLQKMGSISWLFVEERKTYFSPIFNAFVSINMHSL